MDERTKLTPIVAIVGRANVGKSTLFNRLLEKRKALVSPEAGTTRDANYGHFHWRGLNYTAIDTAGLDLTSAKATEKSLDRQAKAAMTKADIIVMVADAKDGLMPQDRALAKHLLKSGKDLIFAVNKADNPHVRRLAENPEWLKLGLGSPIPISAANGSGVGDLLDIVADRTRSKGLDSRPMPEVDCRIAIIGRPNVGKSTLLNALAGEERSIVSEVPHTTTEPQDTLLAWDDGTGAVKNILLVDTVGIRKKARIERGIEEAGVEMSVDELKRSDVALLVVDASQGVGLMEKKLAGLIEESRKGVLIVVNKWDLAEEKKLGGTKDFEKYVAIQLPFFTWAPVVFISAGTGRNVGKLLGLSLELAAERGREIPQEQLDPFAEKLKKAHHAAFVKGEKRPKVYGLTQVGTRPPVFMLVVKDKETIHYNFLRFVENRIRQEFGFTGTPVTVLAREIESGR
jgi:GTP-binding protein